MNTDDMYDKTSTGQKEVNENAAGLSMMERRVLILVNGENDVETLAKLSLCDNIEAVVDRTGNEPHKLSGRAKDMGSAAVFLALMNVVVMWGLVLYQLYFQT